MHGLGPPNGHRFTPASAGASALATLERVVVIPAKDRRKSYRRRAAVDVALSLAELNASWGDYDRALEHLRAADELAGGSLAPRFSARREEWVEASVKR